MRKPPPRNHLKAFPQTSTINLEQLSAIQKMRHLLQKLGAEIDGSDWTNENAAKVLDTIAEGLSPLLDTELDNTPDGRRIIETHAASEVLTNLASALRDIKDGNVYGRFFRAPKGRGSAYSPSEVAKVKTFLGFVDWVKSYDDASLPCAEKSVANALKAIGAKFRGEPITSTNLRSWRQAPPGAKRRSQ
jgi:hypothetical protein